MSASTLDGVRRMFPEADLESEPADQLAAMGKVFGEELPAGLVFVGQPVLPAVSGDE